MILNLRGDTTHYLIDTKDITYIKLQSDTNSVSIYTKYVNLVLKFNSFDDAFDAMNFLRKCIIGMDGYERERMLNEIIESINEIK